LTGFLLEAAPAALILVEKDRYWARTRQAGGVSPAVTVIEGDALDQPWEDYAAPCKIIGNLPYNIASPLMWDIFSRATGLELAVFMIQKEVGLRLTAAPACKDYGALSVWVRSFCRPRLEFLAPPQAFNPRPRVWSAVLSFHPLPAAERPGRPECLSYLLKMFFQQRRKQLGVILRRRGHDPAVLERCGITPRDRPENLTPEQYKLLSDQFYRENEPE
jgi:16S rRNA (adenine1518-N6/adenine1519-N6)-dimethyltransferase